MGGPIYRSGLSAAWPFGTESSTRPARLRHDLPLRLKLNTVGQLLAIFLTALIAGGANAPSSTGCSAYGSLRPADSLQANTSPSGTICALPGYDLSVLGLRPVISPASLSVDELPMSNAKPSGADTRDAGPVDPPGDIAARPLGRSVGVLQLGLAAQGGSGIARGRYAPSALGSTAPPASTLVRAGPSSNTAEG